ncbi:putative cytosolic phospholipase A2 zeta [Podospora australis]|uniref:Lysophospholipase n=1 Tax=Podospora australis TaxID=1536484 RepID=A0AAN6X4G6_9PEZI|nr:putative cytosolic phospholipase A2 zeta [Podospora australis]
MLQATTNRAHLRGLRLAVYASKHGRHLSGTKWRPTTNTRPALRSTAPTYRQSPRHLSFFPPRQESESKVPFTQVASVIVACILLKYWLYPADELQQIRSRSNLVDDRSQPASPLSTTDNAKTNAKEAGDNAAEDDGVLSKFAKTWENISIAEQADSLGDKVVDLILPEWTKSIPGLIRKLQRELVMAPGSLAAEIWQEAQDPYIHPEIKWEARVRVSGDLCEEEKTYLERRRRVIIPALANYLGLKEEEIHPDDIPTIALCGSGGGLRALVAGTGSLWATTEDGLFDCVTYASGVSGSCWLQSLYYSSVTGNNFERGIDHLKARLGTHIADPPTAFAALTSAPTNKYLLSGMVEKFKGSSSAEFSLVDVYGVLLAARLLVPRGELGVNEKDFKLSNQRDYIRFGQNPLPIYTAVRHEIPEVHDTEVDTGPASEEAKERAKREAWFQWFEITPYEFFCEEFSAGIPTWALGRKFKNGRDLPTEAGLRLPEVRLPLLLGIWGSAFCATLSHYYQEIRPLVRSIAGFSTVDDMIWGLNEDLSKVHPIDPASIPNPIYGMRGKLPGTVPETAYNNENIQLMDAGMSNNLPIYPLLRPGRDVDIIVSFDASADIKTDNWLSVVEGYAIQRGIKGWPLGIGWPKPSASPAATAKQLDQAESQSSPTEVDGKIKEAKEEQAIRSPDNTDNNSAKTEAEKHEEAAEELGYCTVWVGTTQERSSDPPPPPKPIDDTSSWRLTAPDAGIAVVYLPFLANEKAVPGVDPATNEYMSTWNFVYTPKQIDDVVALAKANYAEGKDQIRATVRAVYERKKKRRLERRKIEKQERFRWLVRMGKLGTLGQGDQGDQFS